MPVEDDSCPVQTEHEKDLAIIPRTFVRTEIFDGKSVISTTLIRLSWKPFVLQ